MDDGLVDRLVRVMGWAQRANRSRRGTFRTLTAAECRAIAERLRAAVQSLEISLPESASMVQMIRDAEWLGSGPHDLFVECGRRLEDRERFAKAFVRMEQAGRIANFITWATGVSGMRGHARHWIRQRIDRTESVDEQAQDFLFELEMAGRLARWPGLVIDFAEPDILVRYPPAVETATALACKRPRTIGSVARAVERGCDQIQRCGHHGAIIVGTEAIFHRPEDTAQLPALFVVETPEAAREEGEVTLHRIADDLQQQADRLFPSEVAGVLLCGLLTYWSRRPSAYGYAWLRQPVVNEHEPFAAEVLAAIDHLLFTARS